MRNDSCVVRRITPRVTATERAQKPRLHQIERGEEGLVLSAQVAHGNRGTSPSANAFSPMPAAGGMNTLTRAPRLPIPRNEVPFYLVKLCYTYPDIGKSGEPGKPKLMPTKRPRRFPHTILCCSTLFVRVSIRGKNLSRPPARLVRMVFNCRHLKQKQPY